MVLSDLHDAADAVVSVLEANDDWGPSGGPPGQYASDVLADRALHELLDPLGYGILSEESGLSRPAGGGRGLTVVVDPLDGSTNASRGIGWYATCLCVVDADGPWVAVVADLVGGSRYDAVRGWGARRDGVRLRRESTPPLADSLVAISGLPPRNLGWGQFRSLGCASLDLCAVADGRVDGYVDCSTDAHGVWDYLAAALVCEEAGAVVLDARGRDLCVLEPDARRTPVAGAGPALAEALREARQGF